MCVCGFMYTKNPQGRRCFDERELSFWFGGNTVAFLIFNNNAKFNVVLIIRDQVIVYSTHRFDIIIILLRKYTI